jgi:hypothetical protein
MTIRSILIGTAMAAFAMCASAYAAAPGGGGGGGGSPAIGIDETVLAPSMTGIDTIVAPQKIDEQARAPKCAPATFAELPEGGLLISPNGPIELFAELSEGGGLIITADPFELANTSKWPNFKPEGWGGIIGKEGDGGMKKPNLLGPQLAGGTKVVGPQLAAADRIGYQLTAAKPTPPKTQTKI